MKLEMHHGDVSFEPFGKLPKGAVLQQRGGPAVLALGERTGHRHELAEAEVYLVGDVTWVVVPEAAPVAHLGGDSPDHDTRTLRPGTYRVGLTQEYRRGEIVRDMD